MKVLTHDEKYKADCFLKVDGVAAQEYNNLTATDGAFCTWIPVQAGQKLTVETGCTIYTRELQFDLVVDGIIRNVHKYQSKEWTSKRHAVKFQTGFHMSGTVTEADLVVKDLHEDEYPNDQVEDLDTLGCIEVRMWVLQDEKQELHTQTIKGFNACRNWRDLEDAPTYTTLQPTHEIELVTNAFNPPSATKVTLCKKRIASTRPGETPWATFRFFYRTQESINDKGMTMTPKMKKKNLFRFTPPVAKLVSHDEEVEEEDIFALASQDDARSDGCAISKESLEAVNAKVATQPADGAHPDISDLNAHKISGSLNTDLLWKATSSSTPAVQPNRVPNASNTEFEEIPASKAMASKVRHGEGFTPVKAESADADNEDAKPIAPEVSANAISDIATPDLDISAPILSQAEIDSKKYELDDIRSQLNELGGKPEDQWTTEEQETYDCILESKNHCKRTLASIATQQDAEIKECESTIGSVPPGSDDIKDNLIKHGVRTPHTSNTATPEYEGKPSVDTLFKFVFADDLATAKASPATPSIKLPSSIKRKASMTPDHASKRLKEENDNRDKVIAAKRKILMEKKAAQLAARKKADDLELQRKAHLERIEAELDEEIAEMDELREQAQGRQIQAL